MNADLQYVYGYHHTNIDAPDHLTCGPEPGGQVTCVGGRNLPALPGRHLWVTCWGGPRRRCIVVEWEIRSEDPILSG